MILKNRKYLMLIISEVLIINLYKVSNLGKVCIAKSDTSEFLDFKENLGETSVFGGKFGREQRV